MARKQLKTSEVAARIGVTPASFRRMRLRPGYAPEPDGYKGRSPWWYISTIDAWKKTRPTRGKWKVRYGKPRVDNKS